MPHVLTNGKSTSVVVMAWCRQSTNRTWTNVDPDICHHKASLGRNQWIDLTHIWRWFSLHQLHILVHMGTTRVFCTSSQGFKKIQTLLSTRQIRMKFSIYSKSLTQKRQQAMTVYLEKWNYLQKECPRPLTALINDPIQLLKSPFQLECAEVNPLHKAVDPLLMEIYITMTSQWSPWCPKLQTTRRFIQPFV